MRAKSMHRRIPLIIIRGHKHRSEAKGSLSYAALTYTTAGLELSRPVIISFQNTPARQHFRILCWLLVMLILGDMRRDATHNDGMTEHIRSKEPRRPSV